jgi:energy-coupling factor transporter ATP-binding protein EcfA2
MAAAPPGWAPHVHGCGARSHRPVITIASTGGAPVLEVAGLRKEFGALVAVDDVSFVLRRGRSIAIVGESGSGKTTIARMIVGQERPTHGTITACGHDRSRPVKSGVWLFWSELPGACCCSAGAVVRGWLLSEASVPYCPEVRNPGLRKGSLSGRVRAGQSGGERGGGAGGAGATGGAAGPAGWGGGRGAAMLPQARRRRTRAPDERVRIFEKRAGTGEKKGCKRMAETGCVFDIAVPDGPARIPEQVMLPDPGGPPARPHAVNRWYACDITAARDVTIGKVFDEADRRDPGHLRTWIALVDGDICQLGLIQAQAAARGITLAIVIDFIHVLEYLRKAAWCFHAPATRPWRTG